MVTPPEDSTPNRPTNTRDQGAVKTEFGPPSSPARHRRLRRGDLGGARERLAQRRRAADDAIESLAARRPTREATGDNTSVGRIDFPVGRATNRLETN